MAWKISSGQMMLRHAAAATTLMASAANSRVASPRSGRRQPRGGPGSREPAASVWAGEKGWVAMADERYAQNLDN